MRLLSPRFKVQWPVDDAVRFYLVGRSDLSTAGCFLQIMDVLAAVAAAAVWRLPSQVLLPLARIQAPRNAFGVFVTIKRKQHGSTKVHGCIGHYSRGRLPPAILLQNLQRVAHSAAFKDERSQGFSTPLLRDPSARVHVSILLQPLIPLQTSNGRSLQGEDAFSPKRGLLLYGEGGVSATYLPKVFAEDTSWESVRDDLLSKAGISAPTSNLQFYSYQTSTQCTPLLAPYRGPYGGAVLSLFASFCSSKFVGSLPPYAVSELGHVIYDKSAQVRNSAVCATVASLPVTRAVRGSAKAYLRALQADPSTAVQALAVGEIFDAQLCASLDQKLSVAEPDFELPQLICACQTQCSAKDLSTRKDCEPYVERLHRRVLLLHTPQDIFFLNHAVKALCWDASTTRTQGLIEIFLVCANGLSKADETNLLAVAFECGCFLSASMPRSHALVVRLTELFVLLMPRFSSRLGLFAFKKGDCRVDITDHVIRGLVQCA